jgi:Matrixin
MRHRLGLFVGFAMLSMAGLVLGGSASGADPGGGISVVPVHGQAVGHGVRLFVDVFYARGGHPGPPGHGGGTSASDCTKPDDNTQTRYATPFANANPAGLILHVNATNEPSGLDFVTALGTATASWNTAANPQTVLSVDPTGGASVPAQDGVSSVGWARLVPKNVLAATWTWVNSSNMIIEADTFFNTSHPWTTSTVCPASADGNFVVQDIATHEFGHSLGLSHFSDADAQATMYPSAPSDETRKITPTAGDVTALLLSPGI